MKCPSSGMPLPRDTTSCPNCGRYCGRTFAATKEETFTAENRNPHNGGYTQQQQNVTMQYTNLNSDPNENPYNNMFAPININIPSESNLQSSTPETHNPDSNPYDDIYTMTMHGKLIGKRAKFCPKMKF